MHAEQSNKTDNNTIHSPLPTLALAAIGLAIAAALLALFVGGHMATLHDTSLEAIHQRTTSETASMQALQSTLDASATDLEAARQALKNEQAAAGKLRQQLNAAIQELDQTRAQLTSASKRITEMQAAMVKPAAAAQPVASPAEIKTKPAVIQTEIAPSGETAQRQLPQPAAAPPHSSPSPTGSAASAPAPSTPSTTPPPQPDTPAVSGD